MWAIFWEKVLLFVIMEARPLEMSGAFTRWHVEGAPGAGGREKAKPDVGEVEAEPLELKRRERSWPGGNESGLSRVWGELEPPPPPPDDEWLLAAVR